MCLAQTIMHAWKMACQQSPCNTRQGRATRVSQHKAAQQYLCHTTRPHLLERLAGTQPAAAAWPHANPAVHTAAATDLPPVLHITGRHAYKSAADVRHARPAAMHCPYCTAFTTSTIACCPKVSCCMFDSPSMHQRLKHGLESSLRRHCASLGSMHSASGSY